MDGPTQATIDNPANSHVSDAELLARQFTTDDPESLHGLSLTTPGTYQTPKIEFLYNLTPSKGEKRSYVRCAHCKYPNHWRGYVMRCPDGTRFLVGKDCGAKIYGADFTLMEREFSVQRTRQRCLLRLTGVRAGFLALLHAVGEIVRDQVFTQYRVCRDGLHDGMPDLCRQLSLVVARRAGMLAIEEPVRDYAAEERRDARQKAAEDEVAKLTLTRRKGLRKAGQLPKKDDRPIYRTIERPLGQLAGGLLFSGTLSPLSPVVECHDRLKVIFREITEMRSDDITTRQLQALFRDLGEILDKIHLQLAALDAVPQFFYPNNLATVAAWASHTNACNGDYQARSNAVAWYPADRVSVEVQVAAPTGYVVPRPGALSVFRLAFSG